MADITSAFTWVDWLVVAAYLVLTTWLGERLSGKQATIKDFFLGGKSLPWWAVTGSMIATEISALTFIGVPGIVYAAQGDWTYLQWAFGSVIARFIVAYWLVPLYYEKEIYSPYDFMGNRLGEGVRRLVTGLFSVGAVLGQSVRVLVTAIILRVVLPLGWLVDLSPEWLDPYVGMAFCVILIGLVAILWTFLGGMQTVIWTDVIQFCLFIVGGLLALSWAVGALGWNNLWQLNQNALIDGEVVDKTRIFDWRTPFQDPSLKFTLWVGIIAMPFQNLAAFGTDQLNTQRMFCCRNAQEAKKAMVWSSVSILLTLLMLAVGSGLYAWYQTHAPEANVAKLFAQDPNNVFPVWITNVLPMGLSGLVLAGAFAAAISSLDSILAALSQTTLSIWYGRERLEREGQSPNIIKTSRLIVLAWGVFLIAFTILLGVYYEQTPSDERNLINLAFGMISYTYGALLGILLLAIFAKKISFSGLVLGVLLSFLLVFTLRPELPALLQALGVDQQWIQEIMEKKPTLAFPWFFPINAALTYLCAWLPVRLNNA